MGNVILKKKENNNNSKKINTIGGDNFDTMKFKNINKPFKKSNGKLKKLNINSYLDKDNIVDNY